MEHRHDDNIVALVAGRIQAHLLSFETTPVEWFGQGEALADELRFPLFVSRSKTEVDAALTYVNASPRRLG